MKASIFTGVVIALLVTIIFSFYPGIKHTSNTPESLTPISHRIWQIQSIDTMKYSRDVARTKSKDASFDTVIDAQVQLVANTGATHIAIATPYDKEFVPFLTRWVAAARKHNLSVWFRGNFSGWEKWFGYTPISQDAHKTLLTAFIHDNPTLFENGDMFTPCPECENGGPGDPRQTGDITGYRQFLIDEYNESTAAFSAIGKHVSVGYDSMNYDVARVVMDKPTTQALGGIVTIDHYVTTPNKLIQDVETLAQSTGGKIFIGEFGVPIININGAMTEDEQSAWIQEALTKLSLEHSVIGVNYWTGVGGSTALWHDDGSPKPAVSVLSSFFIR